MDTPCGSRGRVMYGYTMWFKRACHVWIHHVVQEGVYESQ